MLRPVMSENAIATGYGLEGPGSTLGRSKKFFSTPQGPDWLWSLQWVAGVTLPGYEADHSPPFSTEVNNDGAIPPPPHMS
jgi:hypothetical protein